MEQSRERWAGRLPFIMAAVGSAVGLGNIWRFPKTVFENGGGAFFIPYFVALITAGIPLMIVEYALGQKYQGGAPQALAAVTKKFRWVGWFALLVGTMIVFYYIAIMSWSIHYLGNSFNKSWAKPFNYVEYSLNESDDTTTIEEQVYSKDQVELYYEYKDEETKTRVASVMDEYGVLLVQEKEIKDVIEKNELLKKEYEEEVKRTGKADPDKWKQIKKYIQFNSIAQEYLFNNVLEFSPGIWGKAKAHNDKLENEIKTIKMKAADQGRKLSSDESDQISKLKKKEVSYFGHMMKPKWILFIGSFITWILIFLIIFKGVKNVGKVVMLTVPLPVFIILFIAIKGMTLDGAWKGIEFYLSPNWAALTDPKIWMAAYGQIFFSLSLGFGILIAYASYMPSDSDISNNAFLTSFANCSTSFIGGFAVFSVLGYLAHMSGSEVQNVVSGGVGLAFITYPAAIAQMGGVWGVLIGLVFFVCLFSLGIDSAFSILEGVIAGVKDSYPKVSKTLITAFFCIVGFLVTSFVFTARSGLMWLDICDNWMSNYGLPLVGLFECLAIGYFSDLSDLKKYINKHSEIELHYWFDVFIKVVTPAILIFLLGRQVLTDIQSVYGGYNAILSWAVNVAGWGLFALLMILGTTFGRNFHLLAWEITSIIVFLFSYIVFTIKVPEDKVISLSAMMTLGSVLLLGGLAHCIYIAMTEKLPVTETTGSEPDSSENGSDENTPEPDTTKE